MLLMFSHLQLDVFNEIIFYHSYQNIKVKAWAFCNLNLIYQISVPSITTYWNEL